VLVGTLWPNEYATRTTLPLPGQPDQQADNRSLLGIAHVIDVPDAFSAAERRRAEALASDRRIRIALDTPDAGLTQVLAAGPELVRWWENAPRPLRQDRHHRGVGRPPRRRPGPGDHQFLAAAAPGYLTATERAKVPSDWLDRALAYATTPLRGCGCRKTHPSR
jgi:hypothetical protein